MACLINASASEELSATRLSAQPQLKQLLDNLTHAENALDASVNGLECVTPSDTPHIELWKCSGVMPAPLVKLLLRQKSRRGQI